MILNTQRNTSPRLAKTRLGFITTTAVILAVAAIYSGPRLVLAQSETPPAAVPAPRAPGDTIEPPAAPPTPVALELASGDKPSAAPGDIQPGPKFKPGQPPEPGELEPPPIPAPPGADVVSVSPDEPQEEDGANFERPGRAPKPPRVTVNRNRDSSLEERMARLERMVESTETRPTLSAS